MTTVNERVPNDQKLRELILFIAEQSEGDRSFGAAKLNKLLFYADFTAFVNWGRAITWHSYQKLDNGPAPRAIQPWLDDMIAKKEIALAERRYYGLIQKRAMALRQSDLVVFSAQEIALVEQILADFRGMSAAEMSQLSHRFIGWQLAETGEDIPYEAALVDVCEPTPQESEIGKQLESLAHQCLSRHGA